MVTTTLFPTITPAYKLINGITISKREWPVNRMDRGKHIRKDQKKMII